MKKRQHAFVVILFVFEHLPDRRQASTASRLRATRLHAASSLLRCSQRLVSLSLLISRLWVS